MATFERDCVIAGGGPAGLMLGYLLARRGLRVTVLEKHSDFLRDFRGDTIHPSTITVLGELGLRERFLELPLTRLPGLDAVIDGHRMTLVDFTTLPGPDNFLVFAPQWHFLDFLAKEGSAFAGFDLLMRTEATELVTEGGTVVGVRATTPEGEIEIRAPLTVATDGRASRMREAAGLVPQELGVPIDVLWFRLPKPANPPPPTLGYLSSRGMALTIDRGDYYQSGLIIPKGGFEALQSRGLAEFRRELTAIAPVLAPVAGAITDWDQVKLLSVRIDRLTRWHRDGFICIGDAAHAMSPVGGVGVNYAIQDAVALSNAIYEPLSRGAAPAQILESVQERRLPPVLRMQRIQRFAHSRIGPLTSGRRRRVLPAPALGALQVMQPVVRRVTARVVGLGFLPEHVAD